jgi:Chaperone of endosialidase
VDTASVCPGEWTLDGNGGNPAGSYLGTADSQPLVLKMNAAQVANFAGATGTTDGGLDAVTGTNILLGDPNNSIAAGVVGATVSGGGTFVSLVSPQTVGTGAHWATIGGGFGNVVNGFAATVSGGDSNTAHGTESTVGGGLINQASNYSTVSGGYGSFASGSYSAIAGGYSNSASGLYSAVTGGSSNTASGDLSAVAGGENNQAGGHYSFAAGSAAHVRSASEIGGGNTTGDHGTFVWSDDSSASTFASTGPDQFLVRAAGGVGINAAPINDSVELTIAASPNGNDFGNLFLVQSSNNAGILLRAGNATSTANNDAVFSIDQYNGIAEVRTLTLAANGDFTVSAGAFKPGGGSWAAPSDARLKTNVQPLDHPLDRLLQLRGVSFEYLRPDDAMHPDGRHNGFIAQEVQRVFPEWVGTTPDGYLAVGPTGFEALSVEVLRQLREEKDAEIADLHSRLDDLASRLATLEAGRGN